MKHPLFATCLALFASSVLAFAGGTAYSALRATSIKLGQDAQNRLVEITGRSGRPQPVMWQLQLEEANGRGAIDVDVRSGQVVGQRNSIGPARGARLNLSSIQLDSDGVFAIANAEAIRSDVSFDRLNYSLRAEGPGMVPVWRVELLEGPTSMVGYLKILADSGNIVERSARLALTEKDQKEARWSKPGEKFKSIEDFFHRAGKKIQRTGYQLKNWASGDGWTDARNP